MNCMPTLENEVSKIIEERELPAFFVGRKPTNVDLNMATGRLAVLRRGKIIFDSVLATSSVLDTHERFGANAGEMAMKDVCVQRNSAVKRADAAFFILKTFHPSYLHRGAESFASNEEEIENIEMAVLVAYFDHLVPRLFIFQEEVGDDGLVNKVSFCEESSDESLVYQMSQSFNPFHIG